MHTFTGTDHVRTTATLPAQAGLDLRSRVDMSATCACGQELDARHLRCTRCGR